MVEHRNLHTGCSSFSNGWLLNLGNTREKHVHIKWGTVLREAKQTKASNNDLSIMLIENKDNKEQEEFWCFAVRTSRFRMEGRIA